MTTLESFVWVSLYYAPYRYFSARLAEIRALLVGNKMSPMESVVWRRQTVQAR